MDLTSTKAEIRNIIQSLTNERDRLYNKGMNNGFKTLSNSEKYWLIQLYVLIDEMEKKKQSIDFCHDNKNNERDSEFLIDFIMKTI